MGQPKPPCQNPQERLGNNREVSLGFTKKISSDEARRCPQCAEPTCLSGCPLGIDIPGFIRFLREGDAVSALERIKKDNPFPAICGRICPAPCESACVFNEEGSPIAIRALERYASDFGQSKIKARAVSVPKGKKIAIVGSGPSAMAAASVLLAQGFKVTMFEAANEPGGILRYGVPEFRLPQDILQAQFEELRFQGLDLQTNVLIGAMKPLEELSRSFDAVLLAIGASLPDFTSMQGENLAGVYYAEEFLMRLQILSKENVLASASGLLRGSQTVIIGNGFAAIDCARLAARLGQEVHLVFGGLEEEMGVSANDLKDCMDEGIKTYMPYEPLKILGNNQDAVEGVQCRRLEIVEGQGSLSLAVVQEEPMVLEAQTVILANSQKANPFLFTVTPQLKANANGSFWMDEKTSKTSLEKVFALGSAVTVVEALASGKKTALQIAEYLK